MCLAQAPYSARISNFCHAGLFSYHECLVDVSEIFYFFSAQGGGRGSPRHEGRGGGVGFFIENPRKGGGFEEGEGFGANWGICEGRGGAKYFFGGAETSTKNGSKPSLGRTGMKTSSLLLRKHV